MDKMTEQMAQKWLEQFEFPTDENSDDALATICEALQEYPKFKAIGTVEELKALKEKSVAKKPIDISAVRDCDGYIGHIGKCPCCEDIVEEGTLYCDCGRHLDWE